MVGAIPRQFPPGPVQLSRMDRTENQPGADIGQCKLGIRIDLVRRWYDWLIGTGGKRGRGNQHSPGLAGGDEVSVLERQFTQQPECVVGHAAGELISHQLLEQLAIAGLSRLGIPGLRGRVDPLAIHRQPFGPQASQEHPRRHPTWDTAIGRDPHQGPRIGPSQLADQIDCI